MGLVGCCDIGGGVGVNLIGVEDSLVDIRGSLPVFVEGESNSFGSRS